MSNIINSFFDNKQLGFKLNYIKVDDVYYFPAKEIATAIGYSNTTKAIAEHVNKKGKIHVKQLLKNGSPVSGHPLQKYELDTVLLIIPGVLDLLGATRMTIGKQYRHWVNYEVVPSIITKGYYECPQPIVVNNELPHYNYQQNNVLTDEQQLSDEICKHIEYKQSLNSHIHAHVSQHMLSERRLYIRGEPDFISLNKSNFRGQHYHMLCIEWKTPKGDGVLADEQQQRLSYYRTERNAFTLVSNSIREIMETMDEYWDNMIYECYRCGKHFHQRKYFERHVKRHDEPKSNKPNNELVVKTNKFTLKMKR